MRRTTPLVFILSLLGPAIASAQVPSGAQFQVSYSGGEQYRPKVALDAGSNMVVVWMRSAGGPAVLMARRFSPTGQGLMTEFVASSYPVPADRRHDVASAADGRFAVSWSSGGVAVFSRSFSADGVSLGPTTGVGSGGYAAAMAMRPGDQEFLVVWSHNVVGWPGFHEVFRRRVRMQGGTLGSELQVNSYTIYNQVVPDVASDAQGGFVVIWQGESQDGSGKGIFGRRFDASGAAAGAEFQVNSYTTSEQRYPAVAMAADGRFVVVWTSESQDGNTSGIFGRRFDAQGAPLGLEFQVNTYTTSGQFGPRVASDDAGNFVVGWTSFLQDGSTDGVFAQRFDASGAPRGPEFRVSRATAGAQVFGDLALDAVGNIAVAWSAGDQDGHGFNVFARRFGGLHPAGLALDRGGNGVLEPGEAVDVVPSWRNANGAAQTVGGTAMSFTGPPPAVYEVHAPAADYSTIADGTAHACLDCYRVAVTATARPAQHWDAVLDERLTPDAQGQEKLWSVHIGGSFTDVPASSPFYRSVETLLHQGITAGCGAGTYCAGSAVSREQLAAFVLMAKGGAGYRPPACTTTVFGDVPTSSPFCPFVEELARRGVLSGCEGGRYCPQAAVSREQTAVFVLRTLDPTLDPPACTTPMFADVPASSPFCRWIEELARRGVANGCGGGNYCPAAPVTREQAAVFIAGAFGLQLYGP